MNLDNSMIQFCKFCIVGVLCTCIDAAIFYTVIRFSSYQVSLVTGYILSLLINYFLTIYWTFNSKPSKKNAAGVVIAHLFNLFIVRMGLMWVFLNLLLLNEKVAYIPTLLISVISNFLIIKLIINKIK